MITNFGIFLDAGTSPRHPYKRKGIISIPLTKQKPSAVRDPFAKARVVGALPEGTRQKPSDPLTGALEKARLLEEVMRGVRKP